MELLIKYALPIITTMTISFAPIAKEEATYHDFLYVPEVVEEIVEPTIYEMEATFYTAFCQTGCIGITKTGDDVRNTIYVDGYRVIAVDPNVIPLRSIVKVELEDGQVFDAIASDTGGDIKLNRIDILVKTTSEAYDLGRQKAKITILEEK